MSTGKTMIGQVQTLIGDSTGSIVSNDYIVDLINEELPRVLARFPKETRVETTQESAEPSYEIVSADINTARLKIRKVFFEGYEATLIRSDEMERVTKT